MIFDMEKSGIFSHDESVDLYLFREQMK